MGNPSPIHYLIVLLFFGIVAAFIALFANPKTRAAALAVLRVGGLIVVMLLILVAFLRFNAYSEPVAPSRPVHQTAQSTVNLPDIAAEVPSPASAAHAPAATAEKGEDEYSQAVASRSVGMLRAMVHALSRALAEEEKDLAAKKGTAPAKTAMAKNAPAWVGSPERLVGDAYQMTAVVGPYTTRQECDAKLPEELQKAVNHYAAICLVDSSVANISLPMDFLRQNVVKGQWEEVRQHSVGPMTSLHTLLAFDSRVKDRIVEEHQRGVVAGRLWLAGVGLTACLLLLAVFYGYLRIDLASGGAHRNRLRFAAATAILGVVVAAALAAA